jgi:Ca2+-binding EF-hand superfamily protein
MGARQSRGGYQQWDMNELSRATGLPAQRVHQIYEEFMQAAGRDGQLNMNEFANLYRHFPGAQQQDSQYMQQQLPRIFRTFDRDGSGALTFDEFLSAVVMMNQNMSQGDRLDFLIRQNNGHGRQQGHGNISAEYGQQVFQRLNDYYGLPAGSEYEFWNQVDQNNRGYVTHQEFVNYINQLEGYNQQYQY